MTHHESAAFHALDWIQKSGNAGEANPNTPTLLHLWNPPAPGPWLSDAMRSKFRIQIDTPHATVADVWKPNPPVSTPVPDCRYVIILASRQRRETLAATATHWQQLPSGATLLLAAANDWGAKGYQKPLTQAFGEIPVISGNKCRLYCIEKSQPADPELLETWAADALPAVLPDSQWQTIPGIFGWEKIDVGSRLLADHFANKPAQANSVLDAGSGNGYLSVRLLESGARPKQLHLVESDLRALDCARANLTQWSADAQTSIHYHWADFLYHRAEKLHDLILMNPPFHAGRDADPALGESFVRHASYLLRPGGVLRLVANEFLPYEKVLTMHFKTFQQIARADGFKVLEATR